MRDPSDPTVAAAIPRARGRAARLQGLLDAAQAGRVTMGAGVIESNAVIIGTSEPRAYLRAEVREQVVAEGETVADGLGHAESNIVGYAGVALLAVGAGRPICEGCEGKIVSVKAVPASECRSGKVYA